MSFRRSLRPSVQRLEPREMLAADFACLDSAEAVYTAVRGAQPVCDLNSDGNVDQADLAFYLSEVLPTVPADVTQDGRVDFADFLRVSDNWNQAVDRYAAGDTNADGVVDFTDFLAVSADYSFQSPHRVLPFSMAAVQIPNRTVFNALAHREDVPGATGIREVKFLVEVDRNEITFANHNQFDLHYHLASEVLGYGMDVGEFNQQTYFTDDRRFIAGSVLAHDNYQQGEQQGIYTLEFWPTDPVAARHIIPAYRLVQQAMPFLADTLVYHPSSETQRGLLRQQRQQLSAAGVRSIDTEQLFANQTFSALNAGVAFGRLVAASGDSAEPLTPRDIVIFSQLPNDLTHVAGVISVQPQTPLSHVNLRAKQNDTPNAYIRDALNLPEIQQLIGTLVRYSVSNDGYSIRPATQAEVDEHLEAIRPTEPQQPARDLTVTEIAELAKLRLPDQTAYGAKAANLGELERILPDEQVPDGVAIPFYYYHRFMAANGLYDDARDMIAEPQFQDNPAYRGAQLKLFRKRIKQAAVPDWMSRDLEATYASLRAEFGDTQPFRARSSTNNEDLIGFTGAGLYRSYTHRPHEGKLENTIRQVWSSLWTQRAFEEREFWRIDHFTAAMGVAIHPNFDLEEANGVAVTKNLVDPNWVGFYVNVQLGEDLVTNPQPGDVPEEFLVSRIGPGRQWEIQYIRRSNLVPAGTNVLQPNHIQELVVAMARIQTHFAWINDRLTDPTFAVDIEFKVDAAGQLVIKQARPWVD